MKTSRLVTLEEVAFQFESEGGSDRKESACNAGNTGSIPGLGRSSGEGNGKPLQYSCLENSMCKGVWQATVHGITELDMTERLTLCRKKKVMFLPMGSGRKNSSLLVGGSVFLFYSGLSLIERGPTTLERAICFTQSTDSNVNLLQKCLQRNIQKKYDLIRGPNIW